MTLEHSARLGRSGGRGFTSPVVLAGAIILILVVAGVYYVAYLPSSPSQSSTAYHWQVHLSIFDARLNKSITIPRGVGLAGGYWFNHTLDSYGNSTMAPIHTERDDGILHIQPNRLKVFVLGDFFGIWGKPLSPRCVLDYCYGAGNPPPFMSAGPPNVKTERCVEPGYQLVNGLDITIIIGVAPAQFQSCVQR